MKHIYCATDSTSCHTGPQIRCKYICNLNININTDVFELEQQPQHDILGKHISVCTGLKISSFPTNQHKFGFKARLENKVQCVSWKHNISTGRIQTDAHCEETVATTLLYILSVLLLFGIRGNFFAKWQTSVILHDALFAATVRSLTGSNYFW